MTVIVPGPGPDVVPPESVKPDRVHRMLIWLCTHRHCQLCRALHRLYHLFSAQSSDDFECYDGGSYRLTLSAPDTSP